MRSLLYFFAGLLTLSLQAAPWTPPVGVPMPPFGVEESHHMYADPAHKFDYGSGPVAYRSNQFGPYTHFVNKNDPNATDKNNDFGTPEKPRATWSYPLPAGSVVQLHGGPYSFRNGPGGSLIFGGAGTQKQPIFIVGTSTNKAEMPTIGARECYFFGDWLVIANVHFTNACRASTRPSLKGAPVLYTAIRDCVFSGANVQGRPVCISTGGSTGASETNYTENLVILRNEMGDYGDWKSESENDAAGVIASEFATHIWILDNNIFHMGGDSIRIGADQSGKASGGFYYVGRNHLHDNRENALDIKQALNAVVSENVMHGFKAGSSSSGEAIVIHYSPDEIWIVKNEIYDSGRGITSTGIKNCYIIGNRIHDCVQYGMQLDRGGGIFHVLNNTVESCGSGIVTGGTVNSLQYRNNLVSNITDANGTHLLISDSGVAGKSSAQNFLFHQQGGPLRIRWAGGRYPSVREWMRGSLQGRGSLEGDLKQAHGKGIAIDDYNRRFKAAFGVALIDEASNSAGHVAVNNIGADVAWARPDASPAQKPNR